LGVYHRQAENDREEPVKSAAAARGCPCPLAGRSCRPSGPPLTACPLRFAFRASLASRARSWAWAHPRSSIGFCRRKPGAEATGPGGRETPSQLAPPVRRLPPAASTFNATRRQDVANQHQRTDENLGFSSVRPRKVGHDARAFRKARKVTATRRQDAANQHQRTDENLGFSSVRPRKVGHDARAFRKARKVTATRRQDVANQHQRTDENLGFSSVRPRKVGQDARAFRKASAGNAAAR